MRSYLDYFYNEIINESSDDLMNKRDTYLCIYPDLRNLDIYSISQK